MAKEIKYSPVSIISQVCGSIATMAAATNPALDASAVGIGTAASAIVGGIEISDKDENIKEKIDSALEKAWNEINRVGLTEQL